MVWVQFVASAALITIAASKLADYGDAIGVRTGLGGMFVGTLLLASATSLPEFLTMISAVNQQEPNLAAGNIFGSSMFNMVMLAVLDLLFRQERILRRVALSHSLSADLAILLTGLAVFFILADLNLSIAWVGVDSLILLAAYGLGLWLLRVGSTRIAQPEEPEADEEAPSLRRAVIGFTLAAGVLVVATPWMVDGAVGIAEITGLSTGVVGVALVAVVTSFPEIMTTISAARLGSFDLAVGNLLGSNVFNIVVLALVDLVYTRGSLISEIDPTMALAAMLGLIMTGLAALGNLARFERRIGFIEIDALALLVVYVLGMVFLFSRGLVR